MGMSGLRPRPDSSGMGKRILAGVFWFLATAYFFQFAGVMFGYPPAMGSLFALGVALFVSVDPLGVLWKRQPTRRIARIPDPAVPADGKHAGAPGT
jgi:hypothetical protein